MDVQQSLFDEQAKMEQLERDKRIHKAAFRVAFDFLDAHYPPGDDQEYWLKTCDDIRVASDENILNTLCQELLSAVLIYLSDKVKNNTNEG